jgi:uncharacterized protein YjiS (DUF1127 family)
MTDLNLTALRKSGAGHYRQAARAVALLLRLLAQAHRARRDAKRLMSLDDYLLKDIGIARCEIEAIAHRGRNWPEPGFRSAP